MKTIMVLNMGSTSSKIALYHDLSLASATEMAVPLEVFSGKTSPLQQLDYRTKVVNEWIEKENIDLSNVDIIASRGGPAGKIKGGAYRINELMLNVLTFAPQSLHESALSSMIAWNLGHERGIPMIIYDGMSMDEKDPVACRTGRPDIFTTTRGHPLNERKVARMAAEKLGLDYEKSSIIVAHLGGSISVCAQKNGRFIDMINANNNGSMSPQRAGRLPTDVLMDLCYSGKYEKRDLYRLINGKSGFMAYCGTQNAKEVIERAEAGDEQAKIAIETMVYQISKNIAEMRIAINGPVDCIIFTGGMARAEKIVNAVIDRVAFIALTLIYPGEYEMDALAEGAMRVLDGQEEAKEYTAKPLGYDSVEQFCAKFNITTDTWAIEQALEAIR